MLCECSKRESPYMNVYPTDTNPTHRTRAAVSLRLVHSRLHGVVRCVWVSYIIHISVRFFSSFSELEVSTLGMSQSIVSACVLIYRLLLKRQSSSIDHPMMIFDERREVEERTISVYNSGSDRNRQ
mmetsp:Transcript_2719/g.3010  ORF Transcript_2719/g.3010 Transcript_2719/m.3010 type:complete len:126 (+) Transcript_2719:324-701(+)